MDGDGNAGFLHPAANAGSFLRRLGANTMVDDDGAVRARIAPRMIFCQQCQCRAVSPARQTGDPWARANFRIGTVQGDAHIPDAHIPDARLPEVCLRVDGSIETLPGGGGQVQFMCRFSCHNLPLY